ncbi:MAG: hypothetical protein A3F74_19900 [Betaproteobacteria bacterium RIFCSPLOWO2_12_FULL_62_58]|nr:MAG: hypothetical protein A3F74_19900 [Betaproteobacteria bacterium RIFCSPLOWO2_12_FULL_62_58]
MVRKVAAATRAQLVLHDERFQPGAEAFKPIGCKLASACVRPNIKRRVKIPAAARADIRREMRYDTPRAESRRQLPYRVHRTRGTAPTFLENP